MPGHGITAAREINAALPETAVVMLTVSRDDSDLFAALRAGARGYLLKDIDPARLPMALEGVLAGEAALPRGLVARLIDEFRTRDDAARRREGPLGSLTDREWEVLRRMQQGMSTAEMAAVRLFQRTARGAALRETVTAANEALDALRGARIEELSFSLRGPNESTMSTCQPCSWNQTV